MSLSLKVEQSGLDIKILADWLGGRVLQPLITALAERAEDLMRERAPRRTGRLASSIRREVGAVEAVIGPRAPYAIHIEYGTRPHEIRPVNSRALRFEIGGQLVFAVRVQHPGTRPNPFLRETAEIVGREAEEVFNGVWKREVGVE